MTDVKHVISVSALSALITWLEGQDDDHWDMSEPLAIRPETDAFDQLDHGENLATVAQCNTVGCIAGHCMMLLHTDGSGNMPMDVISGGGILVKAAEFLGIEWSNDHPTLKEFLFTPSLDYSTVTKERALNVLRHLRDH